MNKKRVRGRDRTRHLLLVVLLFSMCMIGLLIGPFSFAGDEQDIEIAVLPEGIVEDPYNGTQPDQAPQLEVQKPAEKNDVIIVLKEQPEDTAIENVVEILQDKQEDIEEQIETLQETLEELPEQETEEQDQAEEELVEAVVEEVEELQEELLEEVKEEIDEKQEELVEDLEQEKQESPEKTIEIKKEFETINAIAAVVDEETLAELENNPLVEKVIPNIKFELSLDQSIPHINADDVQNTTINNVTITGTNESVCVIDTGIDPNHPDLKTRIIAQQCYCDTDSNSSNGGCCPNGLTEDATNATDANGHGTHVSGIVGAFGNVTGVAPNVNLVAVKVFSKHRTAYLADILSGIDFCVNQSQTYNISTITMSLGTSTLFNNVNTCNNFIPSFSEAVDNAYAQDITVLASSGNNGNANGISLPACLGNVTSVGATDNADDDIAGYSNRDEILDVFAPGSSINSTAQHNCPSGGNGQVCDDSRYKVLSGTSMAAPHTAGATALLQQYRRVKYNKAIGPDLMRSLLSCSGKKLVDSSTDTQFPRIDLLQAINTIDVPVSFTNFTNNQTTNFSAWSLEKLTELPNVTIGNSNGTIDYGTTNKNVLCWDLDKSLTVKENSLVVDLQNKTEMNDSATITLFNVPFNHPEVLLNNELCNVSFCTNKVITSGQEKANISFSVPHLGGKPTTNFSTMVNANLSIFDQNDPLGGSKGLNMTEDILFFANYTAIMNGSIVPNATCRLGFGFDNSTLNMTMNATSNRYEQTKQFPLPGNYTWNISCSQQNYATLSDTDDIVVQIADHDNDGFNGTIDCNDRDATIKPVQNNTLAIVNTDLVICNKAYASAFLINTSNTLLDCQGNIFNATSLGTNSTLSDVGLSLSNQQNVTVHNCTFADYTTGLQATNTTNLKLNASTFINNTNDVFVDGGSTEFLQSTLETYNMNNTVFTVEQILGKLTFVNTTITEQGTALFEDVLITQDTVFVNSTKENGLNKSASIEFYNTNYTNPRVMVKYNDTANNTNETNYSVCPSEVCTSPLVFNTTITFNVTHFTTFTLQETPVNNTNNTNSNSGSSSGSSGSSGSSAGSGGGGGGGGGGRNYNPTRTTTPATATTTGAVSSLTTTTSESETTNNADASSSADEQTGEAEVTENVESSNEADTEEDANALSEITGAVVDEQDKQLPWRISLVLLVGIILGIIVLAKRKAMVHHLHSGTLRLFGKKAKEKQKEKQKGKHKAEEKAEKLSSEEARQAKAQEFKDEYYQRTREDDLFHETKSHKGVKISPTLKNLVDRHREKGWEDPDIRERLLRLGHWDEKTLDAHLSLPYQGSK